MSTALSPTPTSDQDSSHLATRHDRAALIAFIVDATSETALREGLSDAISDTCEFKRGGIRAAVTALARIPTPRVLVVDVSGSDEPLNELARLSEVVEPDVCVLLIGDIRDADFYRDAIRGLGVAEYLSKPLTRDMVSRYFVPLVQGYRPTTSGLGAGRMVTVTGARGGVGASTIAANLAWHLGVLARRHVLLLDPDVHTGTASFLLNIPPGNGLRAALETPDRIDELFVERSARSASDRLHVLASDEGLDTKLACAPGAPERLLNALRRRYSFVVADVPFRPVDLYRDLLYLADQRILVLEPSLVSVRDTLRLLSLPGASEQARHAILVLNQIGISGGLTRRQVEEALGRAVDIGIPYLPRVLSSAANLGEPAVISRGPFRGAIADLAKKIPFTRLQSASTSFPEQRRWWRLLGRS